MSDSLIKGVLKRQVKIVDSTTISLFKDILSCDGSKSNDGEIKVHSVINADEKIPSLVWIGPATSDDHNLLEKLKCDDNTIYVFDKGYNDYIAFKHFTDNQTGLVTRIKEHCKL